MYFNHRLLKNSFQLKQNFSWLFLAFFAAGVICMVCAFALKGKKINPSDPIAWIMFIFYAFSIILLFAGLIIALRTKVAKVIEYNHTL